MLVSKNNRSIVYYEIQCSDPFCSVDHSVLLKQTKIL